MDSAIIRLALPRLGARGSPPTILASRRRLQEIGVGPNQLGSAYDVLRAMYLEHSMSQSEIARILGVQRHTVSSWLRRLEIPIRTQGDSVSLALSKYSVREFDGDLATRAYLIGFRAGDLHAQIHGRRIRASVGTTHLAMAELFRLVFSRFAEVRRYPKYNDLSGFHWCIFCDLDPTFDFLLKKQTEIPDWVLKNEESFYSFLAGYFDAEGCISFDLRPMSRSISLILKTCDYGILRNAYVRLATDQYAPTMSLDKRAGEQDLNSDFCALRVGSRSNALKLLDMMPLRHSEKVAKADLARSIASSGWREGWQEVRLLRASIALDVRRFKSEAQDALTAKRLPCNTRPGSEAGSTGPAT
jgi:hypothetical protein